VVLRLPLSPRWIGLRRILTRWSGRLIYDVMAEATKAEIIDPWNMPRDDPRWRPKRPGEKGR
jgi:hypothetical protein